MNDDIQERIEAGRFIAFLRHVRGIDSQAELSRLTDISRADINRYEHGKQKPRAATFEKIRSGLGIPARQLAFLRWCHRLIFRSGTLSESLDKTPPSEPRLPEDDRAAAVDILERALAMARAEHALLRAERKIRDTSGSIRGTSD
jgi:transcriptional regulator with XRE-family HTH domain